MGSSAKAPEPASPAPPPEAPPDGVPEGARRPARRDFLRLYSQAGFLWVSNALTAGTGLVYWAVVARFYPAEAVGLASTALSTALVLATLATLGLGFGLIRYLPEARPQEAPRLVNTALLLAGGTALGLGLLFLLGGRGGVSSLRPVWTHPLFLLLFLGHIPLATASTLLAQAFVAGQRAHWVALLSGIHTLAKLIVAVVLAPLQSPVAVFGSWTLAYVLYMAGGLRGLRFFPPRYRPALALDRRSVPRLLRYGLPNHLGEQFQQASFHLLPLVVAQRLGAGPAGHFYIALVLTNAVASLVSALSLALMAEGVRRPHTLVRRFGEAVGVAEAVVLGAVGAVFLMGRWLLWPFGGEYAVASLPALKALVFALLAMVPVQLHLAVERVRGRLGAVVAIMGVSAVGTLAVAWALTGRMGLAGPGLGLLAGYGAGALLVGVRWAGWLLRREASPLRPSPAVPPEEVP